MRRVLVLVALATGCGSLRAPVADPKVHVRGEHYRVIHEPPDRLWPEIVFALDEEGFRVTHSDRAHRIIRTGARRYTGRDEVKRLADIADLSAARGAGFGRATEYEVTYALFLLPAGETDTGLKITSVMRARYCQSRAASVGRTSASRTPAVRASCSATIAAFASRCAGGATCCH